jgi:serine/threonine protein kinase
MHYDRFSYYPIAGQQSNSPEETTNMADRVGQQLGNYRLVSLLGHGGFAEVYLGEHVYLRSQAAIKVLYTRLAKDDLENFLSEARTLVQLIHPHIVRVLEFGVENDTPFLVMDYAPNGSLRQRHPKGSTLPLPIIINYVRQVADALLYAHNQKVIHRDVKPENMLIGRQNEVLLSDFGTAIVAQSSRYQNAQEIAGTIAYMAPEQIQSHPRPASDQYSLAIVVYEWLSGSRPFQGSMTEIAVKQAIVPPPSLRATIPTISPAVEHVVLTALEKDPYKRFPDVKAFAFALEQASQITQPYQQNLAFSPPGETSIPTVISQPPQPTPPDMVVAPAYQSSQLATSPASPWQNSSTPKVSDMTEKASPSAPSIFTSPGQSQQNNQRRSRRPIVAGLIVLLIVGLVTAGLVFSPLLSAISDHSATATPTPTIPATHPTVTTTSTLRLSPTSPAPIVYPNIAGSYAGTVHNTLTDQVAAITLSINQNQGSINGQLIIGLPLQGTGTFTGAIDTGNNIRFLDIGQDTTNPILFLGLLQPDGSLSGSYCSVQSQSNQQCDSTMGRGTWNATKQ